MNHNLTPAGSTAEANHSSADDEGFLPNAALDAEIEDKIAKVFAMGGLIGSNLQLHNSESLMASVGITPEERVYLAKRYVCDLIQIALGERIIKALDEHCKVAHAEIIPCLQAYFDAKANGELAAQ